MEQYSVTGMSCAACSSRVEKAVSKVPGVTSCTVSLLTNSMGVGRDGNLRCDHLGGGSCRISCRKEGNGHKGKSGQCGKG